MQYNDVSKYIQDLAGGGTTSDGGNESAARGGQSGRGGGGRGGGRYGQPGSAGTTPRGAARRGGGNVASRATGSSLMGAGAIAPGTPANGRGLNKAFSIVDGGGIGNDGAAHTSGSDFMGGLTSQLEVNGGAPLGSSTTEILGPKKKFRSGGHAASARGGSGGGGGGGGGVRGGLAGGGRRSAAKIGGGEVLHDFNGAVVGDASKSSNVVNGSRGDKQKSLLSNFGGGLSAANAGVDLGEGEGIMRHHAGVNHTNTSWESGGSEDDMDGEAGHASLPERKRKREKRRRDVMNACFSELALLLTRTTNGKADKESILAEAVEQVRRQNNMILELNMQSQSLKAEVEDLRTEKTELRSDKNYLRAELESTRDELKVLRNDNFMLWQNLKKKLGSNDDGSARFGGRGGLNHMPDPVFETAMRSRLLQGMGDVDPQMIQHAGQSPVDKGGAASRSHNECA